MKHRLSTFAFVCALILMTGMALRAQVGTEGAILGVATDASGAVMPGVAITVTNRDTNLTKTAVTDSEGNFEIPALPRGFYSISASAQGFATWMVERFELTLGERKRLSPVLSVGEITQNVKITADTEVLQTEKGSLEGLIEQKQITELPLNGRNAVELVRLIPGMRYVERGGSERGHLVQGSGNRTGDSGGTEFQVDGLNSNGGLENNGVNIPNPDTLSEFNVETNSFSAEHGRQPLQVLIATKNGTNEFHGTLWEFHRDQRFDAFNTFAKRPGATKPKLRRDQYGFAVGGPIIKDRTFFFTSYEVTPIRQETVYNSPAIPTAFLNGDFSSLGKAIKDPLTGQPFPGNIIPANRVSSASKALFQYLLAPNGPTGFRGTAPFNSDNKEFMVRLDQQLTNMQRIYGRYIFSNFKLGTPQYRPDIVQDTNTKQQSLGVNYTYSLTSNTLFTLGANYIRSLQTFDVPGYTGKENVTQQIGIAGFPTEGREEFIGLPNVFITGYTGIAMPFGVPGRLWSEGVDIKTSLNLIRGNHSMNVGYELNKVGAYGRHGSNYSRGQFTFNGQYTGNGAADFLLGLVQNTLRNFPLQTFGVSDMPYSGLYFQDYWKISPKLTLSLGVRWDYWHERAEVRGNAATFDVARGVSVAAEDPNGNVDFTSQPVAAFLAAATNGRWISASEAGYPAGLYKPDGEISPRLGITWRPFTNRDLVFRAGYGIFNSSFTANRVASSLIGPPYWAWEAQTFSAAQQQRWETAWPQDPKAFITPSVIAPLVDIKTNKSHQWNVSVQQSLPGSSALTVSYVGNYSTDLFGIVHHNDVAPGKYTNLQAARPFPLYGGVDLYENIGKSYYHALQVKWEKRFSQGLSSMVSYAFSKQIDDFTGQTSFAPAGYDRGRSAFDRTHILVANAIYELPIGRNKAFLGKMHPILNGILGGWQLSGIYSYTSGTPLSFLVGTASLGNGVSTRANVNGSLELDNPTADAWFNAGALSAPALYTFGNSGIGLINGPSNSTLDTSLSKNFHITESKYLQIRWEAFNALNHVNLGDPVTNVGLATTGKILSAGPARSMQFGVKFYF